MTVKRTAQGEEDPEEEEIKYSGSSLLEEAILHAKVKQENKLKVKEDEAQLGLENMAQSF